MFRIAIATVSLFVVIAAAMPHRMDEAEAGNVAGGVFCTHFTVPGTCPGVFVMGGVNLCAIPISIHQWACFTTLNQVPWVADCGTIQPIRNVWCGAQPYSQGNAAPGCTPHVACLPW